MKGITEV